MALGKTGLLQHRQLLLGSSSLTSVHDLVLLSQVGQTSQNLEGRQNKKSEAKRFAFSKMHCINFSAATSQPCEESLSVVTKHFKFCN